MNKISGASCYILEKVASSLLKEVSCWEIDF